MALLPNTSNPVDASLRNTTNHEIPIHARFVGVVAAPAALIWHLASAAEASVGMAQNKAHLQVVAWVCYTCIWGAILRFDYQSRPSGDLLQGGVSEPAAWTLALANLAGFGVLVISGASAIRNLTMRMVAIVLHFAASIILTFYVMLWYAVNVLGDTL